MPNVWPFPPQRALKETMEWVTEVLRSRSAEQRLCLRSQPRTTVAYDYQLLPQEIESATQMSREWGAEEFLIPFWQELDNVGAIQIGDDTITVSTTNRRYKENGFVFIMGSDGQYEVLQILTITESEIILKAPFVTFEFSGAVVMPCFPCRVTSPFKFKKYPADYFTAEAEFITTEPFPVAAVNPYPEYKNSYVVTDRPIASGSSQETHEREFNDLGSLSGPLFYAEAFTYAVSQSNLAWSFNNDSELWAFRKWMYITKGKQGSFYLPRWTRDFVLSSTATSGNTSLLVLANKYKNDTFIGSICIVKHSGDLVYATILSWSNPLSVGEWQMNLESPIGEDINPADIEMITRMPQMRFNSDRVEFSYEGAGVVNVKLPVMEVPS